MRKTKIYQFIALLMITILCHFFACKADNSENSNKYQVAFLLDRPASIQYSKEWETVQNQYQQYKLKLEKEPQDNETKLKLAQLFVKEARVGGEHGHYYPAALDLVEQILTQTKKSDGIYFLALLTKAGAQLSQHEFAAALVTGNEALEINNMNAQAYGVLVDANVELGNYDEAVKMADKMVSIKPDIRSYSRVSYLREIFGDIPGSLEAMKMAAKAGYPGTEETAWSMLTLGNLLCEYGKADEGKKVFEDILAMRENYPFAVHALGKWYEKAGDNTNAEVYYKKAMAIIPEVSFYISMAELYKKQGKNEEASTLSIEILQMFKDDIKSGHNMNLEYAAFYLDFMNEPNSAMKFAGDEYLKRPKNIDVNRMLAKINVALDMKEEARKFAIAAGRTSSQKPELKQIVSSL